jgi:predicted Zn-dependent peptidase
LLKKHLPAVLPLLAEILQTPVFPEAELQLQQKLGKEIIKQEREKTEVVASEEFYQTLYGSQHPYGRINFEEDYDQVTTDLLKAYHQSHYHPANAFALVTGDVDETTLKLIDQFLGNTSWANKAVISSPNYSISGNVNHQIYLPKENAVQSSLRVGQRTIGFNHPDFNALKIATVVLGGYFGSRLMSNIREEKGYTYGIYSTISNRTQDSIFRVSTEVGTSVAKAALKEIYFEMEEMKQEPIDQEELALVRNYLLGNYMDSLSNIFGTAQLFSGMLSYGRTPDDFYRTIDVLKNITTSEIQLMAQRYFNTADTYEVVVG